MLWLTKRLKKSIEKKEIEVCLNLYSEWPESEMYKDSVVANYIKRSYTVSVNWYEFNIEIDKIKQILVNYNYSNTRIDKLINLFLFNIKQNRENITHDIHLSINY